MARAHDAGGFDRALVAVGSTLPDATLVVSHAASVTQRLGFMVAHRPGFIAPTVRERVALGVNTTLTLDFKYPDGTPVTGTLNYAVASGAVKLSGAVPLNNGQATCMLFNSPSALGLTGQFNVTLSLADSANHSLWQITLAMDPSHDF